MFLFVSQFVSGFLSSGLGAYFVSVYLGGTDGATPVFLGLGIFFVAVGLSLIISALYSHFIKKKPVDDFSSVMPKTESTGILDRNNNMVNQYSKTSETRDRLKVLQVAANAGDET